MGHSSIARQPGGDDHLVACLSADAMSAARSALQFVASSDEARLRSSEDLYDLCDLFHNVAVWLVFPEAIPGPATTALDAVIEGACRPSTRRWLYQALIGRNRLDIALRLE